MDDRATKHGSRAPRPGTKAYELQPNKMTVGEKLRRRLEQLEMRPAEFARRVGTSAGVVSSWLSGEKLADVRWWNAIARVLDASIDDLLSPPTVLSARDSATDEERAQLEDVLGADATDAAFDVGLRVLRKTLSDAEKKAAPVPPNARRRPARSSVPPR